MLRVSVQEPPDHALILRVVPSRFGLEEIHAAFAQRDGDLDPLVPEDEIRRAVILYIEKAHTLAEGAGAASLAAALKLSGTLSQQPIALILSGGNITIEQLRKMLPTYALATPHTRHNINSLEFK